MRIQVPAGSGYLHMVTGQCGETIKRGTELHCVIWNLVSWICLRHMLGNMQKNIRTAGNYVKL